MPALAGFASRAGFPARLVASAVAWAWHLSRGDDHYRLTIGEPPALDDLGLWGIDLVRFPEYLNRDLFDPRQNARIAAKLTHDHGDTFAWADSLLGAPDIQTFADADRIVRSGARGDQTRNGLVSGARIAEVSDRIINRAQHSTAGIDGPIMGST